MSYSNYNGLMTNQMFSCNSSTNSYVLNPVVIDVTDILTNLNYNYSISNQPPQGYYNVTD